ncbi:MAG: amidohydrolase family protein [Polyangiaceae bacterium]
MIIDAHAHFEPRVLAVKTMIEKLDAAGIDRVALIPTMIDPLPSTPEVLLAMTRFFMQRSWGRPIAEAIHRGTMTRAGDLRLAGRTYRIYRQPDNASVAEVLRQRPDRFLGWIFLNPRSDEDVMECLERWRVVPGMIGIKLHPHWHDYRTELLHPLLARAEELGLPVLIHLGFRKRGDFRTLCQRFPGVTFIAAHAGFPFYQMLWKHGPDLKNLHVDLSSPYIDEKIARAAVSALGAERCLYGTDAPYGFSGSEDGADYDYMAIRGWIDRMAISDLERDRIFGGNMLDILDRAGIGLVQREKG